MQFPIDDITDLIPQKPPFVMIDQLLQASEKRTRAALRIRKENIFIENGRLTEPGLVEAMAQTAAAGTGYQCRVNCERVPVGYIGVIQNLEIFGLPEIQDVITMDVELQTRVLQVALISSTLTCRGILLARCNMKIFISNPIQSLNNEKTARL